MTPGRAAALVLAVLCAGAAPARAQEEDVADEYRITFFPNYPLKERFTGFGYVGFVTNPDKAYQLYYLGWPGLIWTAERQGEPALPLFPARVANLDAIGEAAYAAAKRADDEEYRWRAVRAFEPPTPGRLPSDVFFERDGSSMTPHSYGATLSNYFRYDFGDRTSADALDVVPREARFEFARGARLAVPIRVVFHYDHDVRLVHWRKMAAQGVDDPKPTPPAVKFADKPAFFCAGKEFAHFHSDRALDLRVPRAIQKMHKGDPRLVFRPRPADWIEVLFDAPADVAFLVELATAARDDAEERGATARPKARSRAGKTRAR